MWVGGRSGRGAPDRHSAPPPPPSNSDATCHILLLHTVAFDVFSFLHNITKAPCPVACVGLDPGCPAAWLFVVVVLVSGFAAYK
jgi:hypothetical protein